MLDGKRSGIRRSDWPCEELAKSRVEKDNNRQPTKHGRHNTEPRSARPSVCPRQHHPMEISPSCYHSHAAQAKETAARDYAWSLEGIANDKVLQTQPVQQDPFAVELAIEWDSANRDKLFAHAIRIVVSKMLLFAVRTAGFSGEQSSITVNFFIS